MKRHEFLQTPKGQKTWLLYKDWVNQQGRRVRDKESFRHSRYYNAFVKFGEFISSTNLNTKLFMNLMVKNNILPTYWTRDVSYHMYFEHMDKHESPKKLIKITIDNMYKVADRLECEPSKLFSVIEPQDVIQLIRQRCFSPWILLNSVKFLQFFEERLNDHQRIEIEAIVKPDYWTDKFKQNPEQQKKIKQYVSEMNI